MSSRPIAERERETLFTCLEGVSHAGLAVSGGADSMALMLMARQWTQKAGSNPTCLTVLCVDHGLRDEAASEADWVAEQARAQGLECAVLRWRPGRKHSRIQADARQARYDLMARYAHSHGLDALVTAHHLDDQAETLLMRLARGSGLDGLAGIPEEGLWAGLRVIRPFLDIPKARLVATLEKERRQWLEDPSNDDARFERVRLRQAMDELEKLGIAPDALARSARRLRRAREALDHAAGDFLRRHASLDDAGFCRIDATAFLDAPQEIALRALARALRGVGGRISAPQLAKLEALLDTLREKNHAVATLGGCRVVQGRDDILVLREVGRAALGTLVLKPGESGLWDNRYRVSLDRNSRAPVQVRALGARGYGEVRARLGKAVTLPERAAESLVSFWREENVVAVPPLGYSSNIRRKARCTAEFVNRKLFSSPC